MATDFSLLGGTSISPLQQGFAAGGPTTTGSDINIGNLLGGLFGAAGNIYASNQAAGAAQQAGQLAAQQAAFRPVGVTTRFGRSNYEFGPDGRLIGAGYQVAPDVAAMREALLGISGGALQQAQQAQGMQGQVNQAAQGLFSLGQRFLPTSTTSAASPEAMGLSNFLRQQASMSAPMDFNATASPEAMSYYNRLNNIAGQAMPTSYDTAAAAQRYVQQQQNLIAPQREQQLAGIRNNLFQRGRSGLATGATMAGDRAATNPELAAYYNSIAQQDAQIAANADQISRQNLQGDINFASQLGGNALNTLNSSQQQALQNALTRGQFASGQATSALQQQQNAENIARQNLLSNLQVGQGLLGGAINLQQGGFGLQQAAFSPFSTAFQQATNVENQGLQPLNLGAQLGGGNSQSAQFLANGMNTANQLTANRNTAVTGALADPIAQLIGKLFGG